MLGKLILLIQQGKTVQSLSSLLCIIPPLTTMLFHMTHSDEPIIVAHTTNVLLLNHSSMHASILLPVIHFNLNDNSTVIASIRLFNVLMRCSFSGE